MAAFAMVRRSRRRLGAAGMAAAALIGSLCLVRAWPRPPLHAGIPMSTAISAQGGELLRLTLASDGQYRLWVPLDQMPPRLKSAVLLYEDRWFFRHPGVNPPAVARAALHDLRGGRRLGASTITMQLARRLYGIDTRTAAGKLRQVAYSLWIEARYAKRDILEAYLNLAPYGGNVEGAGAASLVFFGRPLPELSVPELVTLAVIPQNPRGRRPDSAPQPGAAARAESPLDAARRRLWSEWLRTHPADARFSGDMTAPVQARSPDKLPFLAPHFTDAVLRETRGNVHATLDLRRQGAVERILRGYVTEQSALGIRNAAALLLEVSDGTATVRAYVGSADYRDAAIGGQVNAVTAKRSPGSTLKPFVYALALDQGLLHPRSILKDAPSSFGPFSPENFDGRFFGPIAAEDALIRSRNVPAVAVASRLGHPNLYDFLQASGVSRLMSERHYGLALALGGGDVSMEELGRMYAVFLNGGRVPAVRSWIGPMPASPPGERLLSAEASFIALDMLDKNPRPDTGQPASPAVAWKTGTSWGFHDAWSAGIFGRYVLVVWIGNFDNTGNPAFVGVQAAAPLFFRIVDALRNQGLDPGSEPRQAPRRVARVEVCAASGDLPNADCPQTVATWYIPGKSPIRISDLHRRIYIDAAGRRACGPGPGVHEEVYEFWTSDMLRLFREAGMPRRIPPAAAACTDAPAGERDAPQIVAPLRGVVYTLRLGNPQPLTLSANVSAQARMIYWFAGNAYLGRAERGASLSWLPTEAGHYSLRAVDDVGAVDSRDVDVEFLP